MPKILPITTHQPSQPFSHPKINIEPPEVEKKAERNIAKNMKIGQQFGELHDYLIDKIAKSDIGAINTIEKKITTLLNRLNVSNGPLQDLIEKDSGKHIYTFLVLIDEMSESNPNMERGNAETLMDIKEQLLTAMNTLKERLALHVIFLSINLFLVYSRC